MTMTSMLATVATLVALTSFAHAAPAIIAPAAPIEGCPSARQVAAALEARLPDAVVAPYEASWRPEALRSVLEPAADGTTVRFSLTTADGQVRLRRVLPVPDAGGTPDCAALADTIAAIVDRYLREIPYEAPPAELPPPPSDQARAAAPATATATWPRVGVIALLGGGGVLPIPPRGLAHGEAKVGGGIELRRDRYSYVFALIGGLAQPLQTTTLATTAAATAEVTLRRFPVRLRVNLALPIGRGFLETGAQGGVDVFSISWQQSAAASGADDKWLISPVAELLLGYRLPLTRQRRFFVRPVGVAGLATSRYRFVAAGGAEPVLTTWVTYFSAGLELGALFR